jgi:hypothetical protein
MGVFLTRREYRGYGFRGTGTIFLLPGRSVESISKPRDAVPGRGCFRWLDVYDGQRKVWADLGESLRNGKRRRNGLISDGQGIRRQ